MEAEVVNRSTALQQRINSLKTYGYRGFRLSESEVKDVEFSVEVGARSNTGLMLIANGKTQDEAYEKLVERIDNMLDGKMV